MPEAPSHSRSRSTESMFRAALPVCTFSAGGYLLFIVKSSIQKTDPAPNCKQFGAGSFFHFSPLGDVVSTSEVAVVCRPVIFVKLLSSSYHQFSSKSAYYILSPRFSLSQPLHEIYKTTLFRIFRACRHFHLFFSVLRFIHTYRPTRRGSAAFPPVKYTYHSSSVIMIKEFPWIILPLQPRLTLET